MLIDIRELCVKYNIDPIGVIHGGAHEAEELPIYEEIGAKNRIWIEGNTEICEKLKLRLEISHKNDLIFDELLWSKSNITFKFNITNNGHSSSILKFGNHKQNHPDVWNIKSIEKKSKTLDDVFVENNLDINLYDFINLDVQGVEIEVLKGFKNNLNKIKYVYTEVNISEVYKNCSKLHDMDLYLQKFGFKRCELLLTQGEWGDAFYMKADILKEKMKIIQENKLKEIEENKLKEIEENKLKEIEENTNPL